MTTEGDLPDTGEWRERVYKGDHTTIVDRMREDGLINAERAPIPPSVHEIALEQGWSVLARVCDTCDNPNPAKKFWTYGSVILCDHCLAVKIRAEVAEKERVEASRIHTIALEQGWGQTGGAVPAKECSICKKESVPYWSLNGKICCEKCLVEQIRSESARQEIAEHEVTEGAVEKRGWLGSRISKVESDLKRIDRYVKLLDKDIAALHGVEERVDRLDKVITAYLFSPRYDELAEKLRREFHEWYGDTS